MRSPGKRYPFGAVVVSSTRLAWLTMPSMSASQQSGGKKWPILGTNSKRAPGTAAAVARPAAVDRSRVRCSGKGNASPARTR